MNKHDAIKAFMARGKDTPFHPRLESAIEASLSRIASLMDREHALNVVQACVDEFGLGSNETVVSVDLGSASLTLLDVDGPKIVNATLHWFGRNGFPQGDSGVFTDPDNGIRLYRLVEKGGGTGRIDLFVHPNFEDGKCRMVKVGTKTTVVDVFEVHCDGDKQGGDDD